MRQLVLAIALVVAAATASPAAAQTSDDLSATWSAQHWGIAERIGSAPYRALILIDRDSLRAGANPSEREFNVLSIVEGKGPRTGSMSHVWIDCTAMTKNYGGVTNFRNGVQVGEPGEPSGLGEIAPNAGLYGAAIAICNDDWATLDAFEGSLESLLAIEFAN